jgi:glycosyltransferase involved in cell wall biosynthesis
MDSGELSIIGIRARARRAVRAPALEVLPQANSYPRGVSIIICTYNRLRLLRKMIDSIRPQLPARHPLEILVVDNNSTDGTADYVRGLMLENESFSYCLETKQGLSNARNGGARAAKYGFLLYCDDDAFLSSDFVGAMGDALAAHDPDLFGGPCLPDYVDPKPAWFPESLEVRRKANVSGFYNNVTLSGSNFGIRREVLERIGGFDPQFGMIGKRPGMLEERLAIETYRRMTPAAQQRVFYSVESFVYHHTPKTRMRVRFQLRRIYQANFNYMKYCLEQGVRTPALLASTLNKRLGAEALRFAAALPSVWRDRASNPERAMGELVRLVLRIADAHAALHFRLTDWGRTPRRLRLAREERPLHILVLQAEDDAPHFEQLKLALKDHKLSFSSVQGVTGKKIQSRIEMSNPRTIDLIITDSLDVMNMSDLMRAHLPHLQFVFWAHEARQFGVAQRPWTRSRQPVALFEQLRTLRRGARRADHIVWSASPRGRIARFVLSARCWTVLSGAATWTELVEVARPWVPRRLSP